MGETEHAPAINLFATANGGASWQLFALPVDAGEAEGWAGHASIAVADEAHVWVMLQLVSSSNSSRGALFISSDAGRSWMRRPRPPIADGLRVISPTEAWLFGGPAHRQLFFSPDEGQSWQERVLPEPWPGARPELEELRFADDKTRVIEAVVDQRSPVRVEYRSSDAGRTWNVHRSPVVERDGRLPAEVTVNSRRTVGGTTWIFAVRGRCAAFKTDCVQETLLYTSRGPAAAMNEITPRSSSPRVPQVRRSDSLAAPRAAPAGTAGSLGVVNHYGIDRCDAMSPSAMEAWWLDSPYWGVGFYIGGRHASCPPSAQTYLKDGGWPATVTVQGWSLVPIWVGQQAVGTGIGNEIGVTGVDGYQQGLDEARAAADAAPQFGVAGTIIYYDFEPYTTTQVTVHAAVRQFIRGWVDGLHARGLEAGVYIARTNAADDLAPLCGDPSSPDSIWIVSTVGVKPSFPYTAPTVSVMGITGLDDRCWASEQRLRQYYIDNKSSTADNETWGTDSAGRYTRDVDNDMLDGLAGTWPSTRFSNNDRVKGVAGVPIRNPEGGTQTGTVGTGWIGTIIDGPRQAEVDGTTSGIVYDWWDVDWGNGVVGWVAEMNLSLTSPQAGTINVVATLDGAAWSGPVRYSLGPSNFHG